MTISSQIGIFTFIDINNRVSRPIEEIEKLVGPLACDECLMRIWEQNRQSELSLDRGLGNGDTRRHGKSLMVGARLNLKVQHEKCVQI